MRPPSARFPVVLATAPLLLAALAAGCAGSRHAVERVPARPAEPGGQESPEAAAIETPPQEVRTTPETAPQAVEHTVRPGETVWRIATTYGLTVDELARANGLTDPDRIAVGQRLRIPGATGPREVPATPAVGLSGASGNWIWPVARGVVLSYFGASRRTHRHSGVDIRGTAGQAVRAARDGVVVYSGATMHGYGKTVILDHGDGHRSLYAHNSKLLVRGGEHVHQGQSIARVGHSGNASTDHCHFEIRRNDVAVDPLRYVHPSAGGKP